ncbi:MAG: hypothetical protein A2Y38_12840 [Spirochaetes bacterium GWB1_59_5]|nr:MAG: hypothetical protein A2Y38_12840 [Spirochaetes bacterium GWB1_59_5]
MQDEKYKTAFAAELLKTPTDPFKAALAVFGVDTGKALRAAHEWFKDPFVIEECARLKSEGFEQFDKESLRDKLIQNLLAIVEGERSIADDRIKAAKVIGELKGLIEKPTTNINTNVITANRVMVVKDHGSADDWEKRLRKQQEGLKRGATTH